MELSCTLLTILAKLICVSEIWKEVRLDCPTHSLEIEKHMTRTLIEAFQLNMLAHLLNEMQGPKKLPENRSGGILHIDNMQNV